MSVAPVVLGAGHGEAIAEPIDLLGIDPVDAKTAFQQGLYYGAMRRFDCHPDYLGRGAGAGNQPIAQLLDPRAAMRNGSFPQQAGTVTRISSSELNMPVDLAPVEIDKDDPMWASNTTLDDGSDFYVANRGNNTIVRMKQDGSIAAIRSVTVPPGPLNNASLNGIATSSDGSEIYVTFTRPGRSAYQGGVLALPAF